MSTCQKEHFSHSQPQSPQVALSPDIPKLKPYLCFGEECQKVKVGILEEVSAFAIFY